MKEVRQIEIIKEVKAAPVTTLFVMYTLKEGVTPEQFEQWVRETDQPAMRSLARVQDFRTYRAERLLMGEGAPGVAYIEAFAIPDLDGFIAEDLGSETVQQVTAGFMGLAEAPQFIIVSEVN
ncbi:MAG TPA: REDY-like protein HapK [Hyphomonas sp.]|nr:REDY-like protein HapK [Hyphomonas sp.]